MKDMIYDYTLRISKTSHTDSIIDTLKVIEKSDPTTLKLIVDNQEGHIYNETKEYYEKRGYKIVKLFLNNASISDQYAVLMDFFALLDDKTAELSIMSIAKFLVGVLKSNFSDGIDAPERILSIKVLARYLNNAYEEGNVSFDGLLSELEAGDLFIDSIKKIRESCGNIINGYDFSFEDLDKEDLVIYIIPPDEKSTEGKTFLVPIILYLFGIYSNRIKKSELVINDIKDIGVMPCGEMKELTEFIANGNKIGYLICYNGTEFLNGKICQPSQYLLKLVSWKGKR